MADVLSRARRTVILLEGVTDPDNVGSIFRAARALGGDLVLLTKRSADPLYRKTIRTSTGAVFEVPYGFCDDGREQVEQFRRDGWRVAALTPAADAVSIHDAGIGRDEHLVLLAGTEEGGLSSTLLGLADARVSIPMRRGADSLNVAVATAIALAVLRSVASEADA